MDNTVNWYDENARSFSEATFDINMEKLYAPFLSLLPEGSTILDAGCGSGRDALSFKKRGFKVQGFDPAPSMAALARKTTGLQIDQISFEQMEYSDKYNGIWACASLIHVRRKLLDEVFSKLANALQRDGIVYMSFKSGTGEHDRDGRTFTDMTQEDLSSLVITNDRFEIVNSWETQDLRPSRSGEHWLNAILKKRTSTT